MIALLSAASVEIHKLSKELIPVSPRLTKHTLRHEAPAELSTLTKFTLHTPLSKLVFLYMPAMNLRSQDFLLVLFILLLTVPSSAYASKEIENGERSDIVVINAMAQELKRSQTDLKLEGYESPYFISYQIKDNSYYSIEGKYGAVVSRTITG